MAASVHFRPRNRDLGMVMREVDENLAVFMGIQNVEMETNDQFDEDLKCAEPQAVSLTSNESPYLVVADDNFLHLETERSDHDWLLKQPDSSLLPSLDADLQDSDITSKSELERECSSPLAPLASVGCCNTMSKRPSSSEERKPVRRAATPPPRRPLSAKPNPSRTATPTLLPSSKPRCSAPSIPIVSKSGSRSSTPTCKLPTPSTISSKKTGSTSRPSKPSDMAQNSHQMPKRPSSASRARPSSQSNEKPRQKSCSPTKMRAPKTGSKMLSRNRGYNNAEDNVNPVLMGAKMVDRVVNMRKLAPPKQDEYVSQQNALKSSQGNSGFGRSLSKKSLEMAIRHMDIGRSVAKISAAVGRGSPQKSNSCSSRSSYFLNGGGMDE